MFTKNVGNINCQCNSVYCKVITIKEKMTSVFNALVTRADIGRGVPEMVAIFMTVKGA